MANGEMHDDGGGIIFCMGTSYNFWEGKSVQKLTDEEVKKIENKAIVFTDQHLMGLSDEDWKKEFERRNTLEYEFFFGTEKNNQP